MAPESRAASRLIGASRVKLKDDSLVLLALLLAYGYSRRGGSPSSPRERGKPSVPGEQKDATLTQQTAEQAKAQIASSYLELTGSPASPAALAMLLAHSAGETGRWLKMHCWNYGFVTTRGGLPWFVLPNNALGRRARLARSTSRRFSRSMGRAR